MTTPDPSATIHLVDVFAKQIEMQGTLAVMSEKLNQLPDHESRIRALERFRFTLMGTAVIGGVASGFGGYLIGHLVR